MAVLIINCLFCPNSSFLDKVLDILCDNRTGVFINGQPGLLKDLRDIYDKMRDDINIPQYVICPLYPLNSSNLNPKINPTNLSNGNNICAGHDLPVWLNDPDPDTDTESCRIMVLSQDPKRTGPMRLNTIDISSPFGLHSRNWRSNLTRGLIHYAMVQLIDENKEKGIETSVYYTDIYKLRKVEPAKTDTTNYFISYNDILCKEICLFQPTIIVTLGSDARNALNDINCPCFKSLNPAIVNLPHPNARYDKNKKMWGGRYDKNKKTWEGGIKIKNNEAKTKIAKIKELIKEKM